MSITRANVEAILVRRLGNWLIFAGLDGTTINGTNADLNDPIGYAVRQCEGTVATVTSVTDADVATADDDPDKLFDVAEYRTLESLASNIDTVTISVGPRSEAFSDIAKAVADRLEKKLKALQTKYGIFNGSLSVGVIAIETAELGDE